MILLVYNILMKLIDRNFDESTTEALSIVELIFEFLFICFLFLK